MFTAIIAGLHKANGATEVAYTDTTVSAIYEEGYAEALRDNGDGTVTYTEGDAEGTVAYADAVANVVGATSVTDNGYGYYAVAGGDTYGAAPEGTSVYRGTTEPASDADPDEFYPV